MLVHQLLLFVPNGKENSARDGADRRTRLSVRECSHSSASIMGFGEEWYLVMKRDIDDNYGRHLLVPDEADIVGAVSFVDSFLAGSTALVFHWEPTSTAML